MVFALAGDSTITSLSGIFALLQLKFQCFSEYIFIYNAAVFRECQEQNMIFSEKTQKSEKIKLKLAQTVLLL